MRNSTWTCATLYISKRQTNCPTHESFLVQYTVQGTGVEYIDTYIDRRYVEIVNEIKKKTIVSIPVGILSVSYAFQIENYSTMTD